MTKSQLSPASQQILKVISAVEETDKNNLINIIYSKTDRPDSIIEECLEKLEYNNKINIQDGDIIITNEGNRIVEEI